MGGGIWDGLVLNIYKRTLIIWMLLHARDGADSVT